METSIFFVVAMVVVLVPFNYLFIYYVLPADPEVPTKAIKRAPYRAFSEFLSDQYAQTYFSLTVYLFLAILLCGLLAGLAYLFSISTAQETEKRSEYECGFAPFDSATRLPFDVHFYLVGILFLIFDVEVALLFPWVLSLRTVGWFGFYLMLSFLLILSVGFLYEWKRGALIWPTRFSKAVNSLTVSGSFTFITLHEDRNIPRGFFEALFFQFTTYWPLMVMMAFFILRFLATKYSTLSYEGTAAHCEKWYTILFALSVITLWQAYTISPLFLVALLFNSAVSWYLERNPFFPYKTLKATRFPIRATKQQYITWARICLLYFFITFISGIVLALRLLFRERCRIITRNKWRRRLLNWRTRRTPYRKIQTLLGRYKGFEFRRTFSGFKQAVDFYFVAPARHIADLFDPITSAMTIYTACGLALIVITLYILDSVHARGSVYENLHGRLDPKIFGIREYAGIELLFVIIVFTASIFTFTGALVSLGVDLPEHLAFIHFVFPDLLFFKVPEFFLTTAPHFLTTDAPAALYLLLRDDIPQTVGSVIDFTTVTLPYFFFELLPERLATETPKLPGQALQFYVENLEQHVKTAQSALVKFEWTVRNLSTRQVAFIVLAVIPFLVRGFRYPEDHYDINPFWTWRKIFWVNFKEYLFWVYLLPIGNAAAFVYNRFLLEHYWKGVPPQFVKDADAAMRAYEDYAAERDDSYAGDLAVKRRNEGLAEEQKQKDKASDVPTTGALFAGLLGNPSDEVVLQVTTLFAVPSIIVFLALLVRNCQLRLRLRRFKAGLAAAAKSREEAAAYWAQRDTVTKSLTPYKGAALYALPRLSEMPDSGIAMQYANNYLDCLVVCTILSLCLLSSNMGLAREIKLLMLAEYRRMAEEEAVAEEEKKATVTKVNTSAPLLSVICLFAPAVEVSAPYATFETLKTALLSADTTTFPMLAEGTLFTVICLVLINLSSGLGKEHDKRLLAHTAWRALSVGFAVTALIYTYQLFFFSEPTSVLGGYFATSQTITLLKLVTLLSALFVLDASEKFMRNHERHLLEYPIMLALTTFFMLLLVSADHVMSSFLSLVGFSLGLYVLILYDANQRPSREAGLKYYYLSTLSSGFILYGMLLIYSLTGTGNFEELFELFNTRAFYRESPILRIASVLILTGFFFKLSAFPGHLWAADVYEGSPAPVTGFFMLPVKVAVLGGFIRLFTVAFAPLAAYWLPILSVTVLVSILWGAFASLQEKKVRRFLAYASINQMGFLLMGLTTDSEAGFRAAILYIIVYAVMTCAFLVIFLSARRADGAELIYISDFRTLASRNWLVGWSLAVILFSMAGIPPLGGFFAKYFVLLHAFEKGLMLEVIVGLSTSLISTYYYLRIIKIVKFEQPDGAMPSSPELSPRHSLLLRGAEIMLWSFVVFAPGIMGMLHTLTPNSGVTSLFF